ncbi:hypothetical protein SAMN05428962_2747 [Paenibacillus sp. BC26]|nr:hypothetical protein SAMN05428962_2747 [Paenibacillus sp. BC26]
MQRQFKINLSILLISLFLAAIMFFLIDLFTLRYRVGQGISGNGNLGVLFIYIAVPIYLLMLVYVYKVSDGYYRNRKNIGALSVILLCLICFCVYGESYQIQSLLHHLGGGPNSPGSVIYRFGWLNQYTNTLYFNFYSFTIGVLMSLLISTYVEMLRRRKVRSINSHN